MSTSEKRSSRGRGPSRTVLVTGASGALGRHLVEQLAAVGHRVLAWARRPRDLEQYRPPAGVRVAAVDLRSCSVVSRGLADGRPDLVFHLAGRRTGTPAQLMAANLGGLINLISGLEEAGLAPKCVVAGSSAQYGLRGSARPIKETAPLAPTNWYGASKAAQEQFALVAWRTRDLPIVAARLFNMVGPGQRPGLLPADVLTQVIDTRRRRVVVGDVSGVRDYLDYRDAARALVLVAERVDAGETINVCSGRGTKLRDLVFELTRAAGRDMDVVTGRENGGSNVQIGDCSKLHALTGFQAQIPLAASLRDMVACART